MTVVRFPVEWDTPVTTRVALLRRLSATEKDVLVAIARGLSNKEIAIDASISYHTVHTHIANIMEKCGVHTRTELAVIACLGFIPDKYFMETLLAWD